MAKLPHRAIATPQRMRALRRRSFQATQTKTVTNAK